MEELMNLESLSLEELKQLEEQIQERKKRWETCRYKVTFYVDFNPAFHTDPNDRLISAEAFQSYIEDETVYELEHYCLLHGEKASGFKVECAE